MRKMRKPQFKMLDSVQSGKYLRKLEIWPKYEPAAKETMTAIAWRDINVNI